MGGYTAKELDEIDKLIESDQDVIPAHEVSCIALATNTQTHTLALLSVLYHDHHGETWRSETWRSWRSVVLCCFVLRVCSQVLEAYHLDTPQDTP